MLGTEWQTSEYSNPSGNCVRARRRGDRVEVGDSKDPDGPTLTLAQETWIALLSSIKEE